MPTDSISLNLNMKPQSTSVVRDDHELELIKSKTTKNTTLGGLIGW